MPFWTNWRRAETAVEEVSTAAAAIGPSQAPRTGFEYGIPDSGLTEYSQQIGGSTGTDRKSLMGELYEAYLGCPWAWAGANAIARTITAGGLTTDWDQDDGEGDQDQPDKPAEVEALERLLRYCNPREDIRQLMRSVIIDLLVFGDAFIEVVWVGSVPVALYSLDSPSTNPIADPHGNVTSYVQVTEYGQRAEFEEHEVIHISLDSPRSGVFGVSPTQAALLPITAWLFTAATLKETFRKGNPPAVHVDMPASMSPAEINRWVAQYMSRNVGPKNIGYPLITKGGATVKEMKQNSVAEYLHVLDQKRDEILAAYGVPPAEAAIIESGNLGGGTGEAQRKMFLTNTCAPIAELVLEKLNYALAFRGFGVTGWHLKFDEVDMRDSEVVERIRDMRLSNGSWTLNKYRTEIGEPPVDGGDAPILMQPTWVARWRDIDAFSKGFIAKNLNGTGLELDEPGDEDDPAVLIKPEPEPVPDELTHWAGKDNPRKDGLPDRDAPPAAPGGNLPGATGAKASAAELANVGKPTGQPGARPPKGPRPARPPRESWTRYRRRVAEAMEVLGA